MIVGTIPPPRFSTNELFTEDVNFCYGSKYGLLWPLMDKIYNLNLDYTNTKNAIDQRKTFLFKNKIGICDMVHSCNRDKIDASDLGMKNIELRDLINILKEHPSINTILFMGGNSKNGPEYLFRKHLNSNSIRLNIISDKSPKTHQFLLKDRNIKTISLISPSNAANRSIGSNNLYKELKSKKNSFSTFDFRLLHYKKYFI